MPFLHASVLPFSCLGRFQSGQSGRPKRTGSELVLTSLNGKVQSTCTIFPAITLQIPALLPTGAGKLSGSDPRLATSRLA